MNRLTSAIVALLVALGAVLAAAPANADDPNKVAQFCVDFTDSGEFWPHLAEDYETWEAMRGHRTTGFGGTCPSGPTAGAVWDGVNPWPAPAQTADEPVSEPVTSTCEPLVIETTSVQTVVDTSKVQRLQSKVQRQRAKIAKLRAKLARR